MKSSDDLFLLIKSLTKSEKRYFKILVSKKQDGKKNYLKLFEEIDKQKTYDEKKIIRKFSSNRFVRHLSSEKNYLYMLILKNVHLYQAKSSRETMLEDLLHFSEILYNKGLFRQSVKILKRAGDIAHEEEMHPFIFKISIYQIRLLIHLADSSVELKEGLNKAILDSESAIKKMLNLGDYYKFVSDMLHFGRKEGDLSRNQSSLDPLRYIVEHPIMQDEQYALSRASKKIFFWIKSIYYQLTGELDKSYLFHKRLLEFKKAVPYGNMALPEYSAELTNFCQLCLVMRKYDEFLFYVRKLKEVRLGPALEKRNFYWYNDLLLQYYAQKGEFEKGASFLKEILDVLERSGNYIHKSKSISIYYHIAYIYLGIEDYKSSRVWIEKVLRENKTGLRQDIFYCTRLLNLILDFERMNMPSSSIIKSTYRFLSKRKKVYQMEYSVLHFLKHLDAVKHEDQVFPLFITLKSKLVFFSANPLERGVFDYLDLVSWLDSKIEGRKFSDQVKLNAAHFTTQEKNSLA